MLRHVVYKRNEKDFATRVVEDDATGKVTQYIGDAVAVTATTNLTGGSDFLSEVSTLKLPAGVTDLTSGGGGGAGIQPDATGALAGRSAYNAEAVGFVYLATDQTPAQYFFREGAAGNWSAAVEVQGPAGPAGADSTVAGPTGPTGPQGTQGPAGSTVGMVTLTGAETLTNKRILPRTVSAISSATPTINTDACDVYQLTAQAEAITSFSLTGAPVDNQCLIVEITGTAARAIAWGASFEPSTVTLPTTTVATAMLTVGFIYNNAVSKWRCVGVV